MKAEQRVVYLELVKLCEATLCTFCKAGDWAGGGDSLCSSDDGYYECQHALSERFGSPYDDPRMPEDSNDDCWGFRPQLPVAIIADIVGIILAFGWVRWGFETDPDTGAIKVGGLTREQTERYR